MPAPIRSSPFQFRRGGVGVVLRLVPLSTTKPSGSDSSPNEPRRLASTPLSCRIRAAYRTPSFFCRLEDEVVYWNTRRLSGYT
jgi:hypothetical protein